MINFKSLKNLVVLFVCCHFFEGVFFDGLFVYKEKKKTGWINI